MFDPTKMNTSALIACFLNADALLQAAFTPEERKSVRTVEDAQDRVNSAALAIAAEIDRRIPIPGTEEEHVIPERVYRG